MIQCQTVNICFAILMIDPLSCDQHKPGSVSSELQALTHCRL